MRPITLLTIVAAACLAIWLTDWSLAAKLVATAACIGFSPGMPCCQDCDIFADDFSVDNLATDWNGGSSGTWSVAGGVLSTSSTGAYRIATTGHPDNTHTMRLTFRVQGASGDVALAYVGWENSGSYTALQITFHSTSGQLAIIEDGATIATVAGLTIPTGTYLDAELCVTPNGQVVVGKIGSNSVVGNSTGRTAANKYFGVGTGGTAAAVSFDDVAAFRTNGPCLGCSAACPACWVSQAKLQYQIDLAGLVQGAKSCASCASLDGTYVVTRFYSPTGLDSGCNWQGSLPSTICGVNRVRFNLTTVRFFPFPDTGIFLDFTNFGVDPDCANYNALPFDDGVNDLNIQCDASGATLDVTAL